MLDFEDWYEQEFVLKYQDDINSEYFLNSEDHLKKFYDDYLDSEDDVDELSIWKQAQGDR